MKLLKIRNKDMRHKKVKKARREEWHRGREQQRMKTFEVKLNFVAGLLNRFFSQYLSTMVTKSSVNETVKSKPIPIGGFSKDSIISININANKKLQAQPK